MIISAISKLLLLALFITNVVLWNWAGDATAYSVAFGVTLFSTLLAIALIVASWTGKLGGILFDKFSRSRK